MTELLLVLRSIRSLKSLEMFLKSCIFYLEKMSSIENVLQNKFQNKFQELWKSEGSSGLKDHLVFAVVKGLLVSCVNWWKQPSTSKKRNSDETHLIRKPLNCNFKNAVYLTECNQCWKQYTDSSKTTFRYGDNNYKKYSP